MAQSELITVYVNQEEFQIPAGTCLLSLLQQIDEPYAAGIVELNAIFVHKDKLATQLLQNGDKVEVILPAFGG